MKRTGQHSWRTLQTSWASSAVDADRVFYQAMDGTISLTDLRSYVQQAEPSLGDDEIMINFATVKWSRPSTDEEREERRERERMAHQRHEEWEARWTLAMVEKHGHDLSKWPGYPGGSENS